ncbi:MAG TPA: hypothetical protein PKJ99_10245 [Thermoanaerobaculales bacterium]|nr:hypothetical protein [Thermoanaerobaculales bacterium]HPA80652.1 hypothetical protein [Thermoanaerobaculales bacterium]HQN97012.1 hypothetical protein [Thermoanaerobaculales bacterium]HQP43286.1 hypothetical protein [Thermoanaerobaculales bacterium]
MRTLRHRGFVVLAVGLLAVAAAGVAIADEKSGETMSLRGCLNEDADGLYTLIEQESGDKIKVQAESSKGIRLEDHVGHTVRVTGQWVEEESQYLRYFKVSAIDSLSESCQP